MIVEGGNLKDKFLRNKEEIEIGTRVVVTAAIAPDVRTGVVVRLSRHGVSVRHDYHQEGAYLNWTFDEVSVVSKGV